MEEEKGDREEEGDRERETEKEWGGKIPSNIGLVSHQQNMLVGKKAKRQPSNLEIIVYIATQRPNVGLKNKENFPKIQTISRADELLFLLMEKILIFP